MTMKEGGFADTISTRMRAGRDVRLRDLIQSIAANTPNPVILDVGGRAEYWQRVGIDFLRENRTSVIVLNLARSELKEIEGIDDVISTAVGNGCDLAQYADGHFDLVHSNSVIEHVVTWQNMVAFARETRRAGKCYYVQTPYFWFPIDPHFYKAPFFHWMLPPMRAWLLTHAKIAHGGRAKTLQRAYEIIDDARLLDLSQFKTLFPDAKIHMERILGLPKSIIGIRGPQ